MQKRVSPETLVIGSKFWGHDSSVFIVMPGEKRVCAMQTERVTRYKHDWIFPLGALQRLIEREGIEAGAVRRVLFCNSFETLQRARLPEDWYEIEMLYRAHFKARYKKEVESARAAFASKSMLGQIFNLFGSFSGWHILARKALLKFGVMKILPLGDIERKHLRRLFPNAHIDVRFYDHEYCHAACAYVTAPFNSALVCTMDGWGDGNFSRVFIARDNALRPLAVSPRDPLESPKLYDAYLPSLGGIYSYFTKRLGFTPEEDEGKVEALAAYSKPIPELLDSLERLVVTDGLSLSLDSNAFAERFAPERFAELLAAHTKEDLSATVQTFLERRMLAYVSALVGVSSEHNLVLAGGVAANVINNLNLYERITPNLHITPAMGDDGSAQGAAYAYLLESGEDVSWIKKLEMPYYETSYTREEVKKTLQKTIGIAFVDMGEDWPERAAQLVAEGKIGAIFHGAAEWGPRALGHRSIIADARRKDFRDIINRTIKRRPLFQPFCPSILAEEKDRLFESAYLNKHMTTAFRLKKEFWEALPSATHIDGTARAQFVEQKDDPNYYRLLKKVKELTGFGVIINTSFNKHGRTIVESPHDAIDDFLDTDMDYLLIEGFFVMRT